MVHGSGKVDSWQELGTVFSVAPQADVGENKFDYRVTWGSVFEVLRLIDKRIRNRLGRKFKDNLLEFKGKIPSWPRCKSWQLGGGGGEERERANHMSDEQPPCRQATTRQS